MNKAGVDVGKILEARKLSREIIEEITITAAAPPALQPLRMTTSAKRYARSAEVPARVRRGDTARRASPHGSLHLQAVGPREGSCRMGL